MNEYNRACRKDLCISSSTTASSSDDALRYANVSPVIAAHG